MRWRCAVCHTLINNGHYLLIKITFDYTVDASKRQLIKTSSIELPPRIHKKVIILFRYFQKCFDNCKAFNNDMKPKKLQVVDAWLGLQMSRVVKRVC